MKFKNNLIYKFALLILLLSACKHKSIIDQNIMDYMLKYGHNPDSYEPISTTCTDTVTQIENLTLITGDIQKWIEYYDSHIKDEQSLLTSDSIEIEQYKRKDEIYGGKSLQNSYSPILEGEHKLLNDYEKTLLDNKNDLTKRKLELDSMKKSANQNSIYGYHFLHQCRGRVPLGGMMLKNIYIETDKDFNIQKFEEM